MKNLMTLFVLITLTMSASAQTNDKLDKDYWGKPKTDQERYASGAAGRNRMAQDATKDTYFCFAATESGAWGVKWVFNGDSVWAYKPQTTDETLYIPKEWIYTRSGIFTPLLVIRGDTCLVYTMIPTSHRWIPSGKSRPQDDVELRLERTFAKSKLSTDDLQSSIKQPDAK